MASATMDLAYVSEAIPKIAAQLSVERSGRMIDGDSARRIVAEALYLRHEVIELQRLQRLLERLVNRLPDLRDQVVVRQSPPGYRPSAWRT